MDTPLIDAVGVRHQPVVEAPRIVSLVPSITELLFALGLGDYVVGRTHYCIHPAAQVAAVPVVGGTKKIKQAALRALAPTHVILNIDENTRAMAQAIKAYTPQLIVTHPLAPIDNLALYRLLGGIFRRGAEAEALCARFEAALTALQAVTHEWPRQRVLYLIWRKPWMTVARATYISRMLALVGWDTLPEHCAERYPRIEIDRALLGQADWVLFSSEPYSFSVDDLPPFAADHGYPLERLALIDGEMTSWYGSRAIAGLDYLRRFAAGRRA